MSGVLKAVAVTYTEVQKGILTWILFKIEYNYYHIFKKKKLNHIKTI